ncbi:MAG TPA: hypothetical protein VGE47_04225 [Burkholderiaceae bacterium]
MAISLATPLLVGACASNPQPANLAAATPTTAASSPAAASSSPDTTERMGHAIAAPLNDLNLVKVDIPPVLQAARKGPYALPVERSCAALAAEVRLLDAALGADLDAPAGPERSLGERGGEAAGNAVVDAVRNTAEGVIPFRGWLRKLTGAERYSREVAASVAAGGVRRAYLKGLGQAAGCEAPAAPRPAQP